MELSIAESSKHPGEPALAASDSSIQPSLDIQDNKHGAATNRQQSTPIVGSQRLPTLEASPGTARSAASIKSSGSTSGSSVVNQNRMSIAPSLARNSLISQYSPIIERATSVSVTASQSTPPGAVSTTTAIDTAAYNDASLARTLSIERVRNSTNQLESLLSDMRALRRSSGSLSPRLGVTSGVSSPLEPSVPMVLSSHPAARPGPSRSTPVPVVTNPPVPLATVGSYASSLRQASYESLNSDTASVSRIAPPLGMKSADSLNAAKVESQNPFFAPTVAGVGAVPRAMSSGPLHKDPPSVTGSEPSSGSQGHSRVESAAPVAVADRVNTPSPSTVNVPQFPLPNPPQKSGMKTQTHTRSTSLPVRFAEGHDVIENLHTSTSASESTDSEATAGTPTMGTPTTGTPTRHVSAPLAKTRSAAQQQQQEGPDFSFPPHAEEPASDRTSKSSLDFKTAPSSPFVKSPVFAEQPLGKAIVFPSAAAVQGLEDLPSPPFVISKQESLPESSNDSYVTARSEVSDFDDRLQSDLPGAVPFNTGTRPLSFSKLAADEYHSPDIHKHGGHSSNLSTPKAAALLPAVVIASREKSTPGKNVSHGHQRTVSSPLLSHMPAPPSSASSASLQDVQEDEENTMPLDQSTSWGAQEVTPPQTEKKPGVSQTVEAYDTVSKKEKDVSRHKSRPERVSGVVPHRHEERKHKHRRSKIPGVREEQHTGDYDEDGSERLYPKARVSQKTKRFSNRDPSMRPFSQSSIQRLMDLSDISFKLDEIDMPPTERQLIEKFVNALAKLSADITDDQKKRPEGIRRLHNALRAIEGWI